MAQILVNSRMAAFGRRPMCQDTGTVHVFAEIGIQARFDFDQPLSELVDEAVARAWSDPDNPLRASMVDDPLFARRNTGTNGPAMLHIEMTGGSDVTFHVAAKGGGSENKARFAALNPGADVAEWVIRTVETLGAGWCPPGVLGIGVGGSGEKAFSLARKSLLEPLDMSDLLRRGPSTKAEEMRIRIYEGVNALGIGAQGLGG
ncbi:MAG: fumarate hydratase, partial [Paracoccus sp. (in: a-proteobacteria)]